MKLYIRKLKFFFYEIIRRLEIDTKNDFYIIKLVNI